MSTIGSRNNRSHKSVSRSTTVKDSETGGKLKGTLGGDELCRDSPRAGDLWLGACEASFNYQGGKDMERVKTQKEFQEYWKKDKLVIDFTASWCGPCTIMKPMLDRLSKDEKYKDVAFIVCDIDGKEMMTVSDMMNVRSVPTIFFVRNGVIQRTSIGLLNETSLKRNLALLE